MQHAAQSGIHILSIMAVDDPLGDTVFFCHLQIVNVGKAVDIDPDGLIFMGMSGKKRLELFSEADGVLPPGSEMNRPAAHGMDLVLKRHRIIRVAQKIKMKAAQVDPAVIVHEKAFYSTGIFRHTENQYIIHKLSSAIAGISSFPVTCPAAFSGCSYNLTAIFLTAISLTAIFLPAVHSG